jgi:hypothetical protein
LLFVQPPPQRRGVPHKAQQGQARTGVAREQGDGRVDGTPERRPFVFGSGPGCQSRGHGVAEGVEDEQDDILLAPEVPQEGAARNAGRGRKVIERDVVEAGIEKAGQGDARQLVSGGSPSADPGGSSSSGGVRV